MDKRTLELKLDALDQLLYSSISIAQEIIYQHDQGEENCTLNRRREFNMDRYYQDTLSELYNKLKDFALKE